MIHDRDYYALKFSALLAYVIKDIFDKIHDDIKPYNENGEKLLELGRLYNDLHQET